MGINVQPFISTKCSPPSGEAASMEFEFATASRILFGAGVAAKAGALVMEYGRRPLIVGGRNPARSAFLTQQLNEKGIEAMYLAVPGEPTIEDVTTGVDKARALGCDVVVGAGGGSAMDAAKAIAALMTNEGDPLDYLEVVGSGRPLENRPAPCIAIPATAGSGAEVTRNAVLTSPAHHVKVSLRHPWMLPVVALVDPLLTHSLPPGVTASTGLDAFTQLLEAFVSRQANPLTDALCREGLQRAAGALRTAYADGACAHAREDMSLASLFGGLALANAKLGAVHGLAGVIGGLLEAPHGAVCARLLPFAMAANVRALRARDSGSPALARYSEVARLITRRMDATAEDGIAWVKTLCEDFHIAPLSEYGLHSGQFAGVAGQAMRSSSMRGNPIDLNEEELLAVLEQACSD